MQVICDAHTAFLVHFGQNGPNLCRTRAQIIFDECIGQTGKHSLELCITTFVPRTIEILRVYTLTLPLENLKRQNIEAHCSAQNKYAVVDSLFDGYKPLFRST